MALRACCSLSLGKIFVSSIFFFLVFFHPLAENIFHKRFHDHHYHSIKIRKLTKPSVLLFLSLPPSDERQVLSFSILDITQHSAQSECQSFQFHQSCLFLSFGLMSLFNVYFSYWILPEMSQKSAQPIFASPQFWWTLCWSLKYESTQPFVLGILSLFSVFCWMQKLAAAE